MKKILLTTISLIICNSSFSQERVNREKLKFEKSSTTLEKATGWSYSSQYGEWVDYSNVISNDKMYKGEFKSLQGRYMMSHNTQNFTKIQTRTITHNGEIYYVLIVEKWSGQYKYPHSKIDWNSYKVHYAYIFSENEYSKLNDINELIELKTQIVAYVSTQFERYTEVKFLDLIQTELHKELDRHSLEYGFPVMKSNEGKIRFYTPVILSKFSKNYDFEKEYFETDIDNFSKIIIK